METVVKAACLHAKQRLNKTDADIAAATGLSESTVRAFFSERSKNPSLNTAGLICRALGVSLDELFGILAHRLAEDRTVKLTIGELNKEAAQYQSRIVWLRRLAFGLLGLCILMAAVALIYLIYFDLGNPNYGLFRG